MLGSHWHSISYFKLHYVVQSRMYFNWLCPLRRICRLNGLAVKSCHEISRSCFDATYQWKIPTCQERELKYIYQKSELTNKLRENQKYEIRNQNYEVENQVNWMIVESTDGNNGSCRDWATWLQRDHFWMNHRNILIIEFHHALLQHSVHWCRDSFSRALLRLWPENILQICNFYYSHWTGISFTNNPAQSHLSM